METPSEGELSKLAELARRQQKLEDEIQSADAKLKKLKEKHRKVSEEDIPSLLDEIGVSELRLDDGTKVVVKEDIRVSTTGKWRDAINQWLEESGHDDIIKDQVKVDFGKGEAEQVDELLSQLKSRGLQVDRVRAVNPQTFAALIRELMADGEDVPLDEIGAFVQKRTKLER